MSLSSFLSLPSQPQGNAFTFKALVSCGGGRVSLVRWRPPLACSLMCHSARACPWCAAADQWPSLERMTTVESGRNETTFWSSFFFSWNSEMQWTHGMVEGGLGWELEVLVLSVETPLVSVPVICSMWVLNWMTSRASQRGHPTERNGGFYIL